MGYDPLIFFKIYKILNYYQIYLSLDIDFLVKTDHT